MNWKAKRMNDVSLSNLVNIPLARELFGSPQYGYFKRLWEFSHAVGNDGSYVDREWQAITEEEFAAFGHLNGVRIRDGVYAPYWQFEKRAVSEGWPQELIRMLREVDYE